MLRLSRNPSEYNINELNPEATSVLYLVSGVSQVRLEFYSYQEAVLMMARHRGVVLCRVLLSPVTRTHTFEFDGHICTLLLVAMHLPQTIDVGFRAPREVKVIRGEIAGDYDLSVQLSQPSFSSVSLA